MDSESQDEDWMPPAFFVGHHETTRKLPVTSQVVEQALKCNYDMLTTPITNDHFHTRINELISNNLLGSNISNVQVPPLEYLDTHLFPGDTTSSLLAFTSSWIDICSPDPLISGISKQILCMEVAYAVFCGIDFLFVQGPKLSHRDTTIQQDLATNNVVEYARTIQQCLGTGHRLQISIILPMSDDTGGKDENSAVLKTREQYLEDIEEEWPEQTDGFGTWDAWNAIRTFCNYHSRLYVAIAIPRRLPPLYVQSRWFSEPIKAMILSDGTFTHNSFKKPGLLHTVQKFIKRMMRLKISPWILLQDVGPIPGLDNPKEHVAPANGFLEPEAAATPTLAEAAAMEKKPNKHEGGPLGPLNCIRSLQHSQAPRSEVERYGSGYQDYLQVPLQPLTYNLESLTYEVFEKDPVKYDLYEKAIKQALVDWKKEHKPTSGLSGHVVVAVCGAGRGPLVTRALKASEAANVPISLWAVEKNPNAFVLLQRHNREDWNDKVTLVQSDMRSWRGPFEAGPSGAKQNIPIDILISELLGSFADNELSPECLDGMVHLLARPHGISIPRSYTAHLTPIAAPKLHADVASRTPYEPTAPETPAVVWLHAVDFLSTTPTPGATGSTSSATKTSSGSSTTPSEPLASFLNATPNVLKAWSFEHGPVNDPEPHQQQLLLPSAITSPNTHNARHVRLRFRTRYRGVCHGLAGYFESVLYPGVELSTNPNTMDAKSRGMISWFPIFFPLKTPLYFPSASALDVSIWRQTDGRKVWYEWMIESWRWNLLRVGGVGKGDGGEKGQKGKERDEDGKGEKDWSMVRLGMTELHSSIKNGCLM